VVQVNRKEKGNGPPETREEIRKGDYTCPWQRKATDQVSNQKEESYNLWAGQEVREELEMSGKSDEVDSGMAGGTLP